MTFVTCGRNNHFDKLLLSGLCRVEHSARESLFVLLWQDSSTLDPVGKRPKQGPSSEEEGFRVIL